MHLSYSSTSMNLGKGKGILESCREGYVHFINAVLKVKMRHGFAAELSLKILFVSQLQMYCIVPQNLYFST